MGAFNSNIQIMSNDITNTDVISRADIDRVEELIQIARDKRRERRLDEFREMKINNDHACHGGGEDTLCVCYE